MYISLSRFTMLFKRPISPRDIHIVTSRVDVRYIDIEIESRRAHVVFTPQLARKETLVLKERNSLLKNAT